MARTRFISKSTTSEDTFPWIAISLIAGICVHLAIALPYAYTLNVWSDEASSLFTTSNGLLATIDTVFANEKQAPLYFLLLSVWRSINESVFFARILSIIAALSAIYCFSVLVQRFVTERAAAIATFLFAVHPFVIWASLEIRVYAFVILVTCLLLEAYFRGFADLGTRRSTDCDNEKSRSKYQVGFAVIGIVGVYLHYYVGFLLVGGLAALIATGRYREARRYLVLLTSAGLLILPLFIMVFFQFEQRSSIPQENKTLLDGVRTVWRHFLFFVLPTELFLDTGTSIVSTIRLWIVRIWLVATVLFFAVGRFSKVNRDMVTVGTFAATVAVFFCVANLLVGPELLAQRHASVYFVPIVLLAITAIDISIPKYLLWFPVLVFMVFSSYSVLTMYPENAKRGDWIRVARYLEQHEMTDQPVVIFDAFDVPAIKTHYNGKNEILPDSGYFDFFLEGKLGTAEAFRSQIEFIIGKVPPEARHIWLITHEKCSYGNSCRPLEDFVEDNFVVLTDQAFYKERVRLLERRK